MALRVNGRQQGGHGLRAGVRVHGEAGHHVQHVVVFAQRAHGPVVAHRAPVVGHGAGDRDLARPAPVAAAPRAAQPVHHGGHVLAVQRPFVRRYQLVPFQPGHDLRVKLVQHGLHGRRRQDGCCFFYRVRYRARRPTVRLYAAAGRGLAVRPKPYEGTIDLLRRLSVGVKKIY